MDNVTRACIPCTTRILVTNNNNYRVLCPDEKSENAPTRWSSPANWTRTSPESLERVRTQTSVSPCVRVRVALLSVLILVTLVTAVGLAVAFLLPLAENRTIPESPSLSSTVPPRSPPRTQSSDHETRHRDREYKKRVSRLSWNLLNKPNPSSEANGNDVAEDGIVLPSNMVFTSAKNPGPGVKPGQKPRNCCRTQKYSQVISSEGCESVTIVNRRCLGTCVAVWVPGIFESFPVCSPSRSTWKSVTLVCGQNRDKRKRVRVERIKRCSCMEAQSSTTQSTPTTPALPLVPLL